jgi:hypothetical protein
MGHRIRGYVKRTLAVSVALTGLIWTADWLLLRYKVQQDGAAFGEVEVHYRYSVHLKNKRIEQRAEKAKMEECVRSMFPHYDETPCWYLERHANRFQELNGGAWHFFYEE